MNLHQGDHLFRALLEGEGQVLLLDVRLALGHLLLPARRHLGQPGAAVLHEQRLDVGGVARDLLIVGPAAERHQSAGDDVGETSGELAEGRRVALAGQLVGDARGDLGDARETADGVVARRDLRVAEVEHVELVLAPGPLGLSVDPPQ